VGLQQTRREKEGRRKGSRGNPLGQWKGGGRGESHTNRQNSRREGEEALKDRVMKNYYKAGKIIPG